MPFVDEVVIEVEAGAGGRGCVSFKRPRGARHRRPDGGDGGRGGDVIVEADSSLWTLADYRYPGVHRAGKGDHGGPNNRRGAAGRDIILKVPVGTMIYDAKTGHLIQDLTHSGQSAIVARGGCGGIGNAGGRTPHPPQPGEQRSLRLEMRVMADVGLVGLPNAGKSSLIRAITQSPSAVAAYPFTTKHPVLGAFQAEDRIWILADLPGLVEGAHEGRGLGHRFLRHLSRCRLLVFVLDMAGSEGRHPIDDMNTLLDEIGGYQEDLLARGRLIAANKMDLPQAASYLKDFMKTFPSETVIPISAQQKTNVDRLLQTIHEQLKHLRPHSQEPHDGRTVTP